MKKLWFALLFLAGGWAHELRHPTTCLSIASSHSAGARRRAGGT